MNSQTGLWKSEDQPNCPQSVVYDQYGPHIDIKPYPNLKHSYFLPNHNLTLIKTKHKHKHNHSYNLNLNLNQT